MSQPPYARLLKPRMAVLWWLDRPSYIAFMLRELSSVFVAWFVVYLLLLVHAVGQSGERYRQFLEWSASPWLIALNALSLAFILLHAITFINLTPQAMMLRLRGRPVPGRMLAAGLYALWIVVSALLAWLVMG